MLIQALRSLLWEGVGGWRIVKRGDGWIAREKENGEETWGGKSARRNPLPVKKKKKSPPLTLPTHFTKRGGEKREERRGILVGQGALGETMPIMLLFDL